MEKNNTTPAKKVWQKPDLYLLDTSKINTGGLRSHHERSINITSTFAPNIHVGTIPGRPSQYIVENYVS